MERAKDSGNNYLDEESRARVGYVYDIRMKNHMDLENPEDPHPEDPRRIYWVYDILERAGCLSLMERVPITLANDRQITRIHKRSHVEFMKRTELLEKPTLVSLQDTLDSVYLCKETNYCAKLSAGALTSLCVQVAKGNIDSGIAIIRPPGHHACVDTAMGFCIYNNIAIAIGELQAQCLAERIMVVDWDVHHGNGIQDIFYSKNNVLYCSIHRYDAEDFYPRGNKGDMRHIGAGIGKGYNINIPWPSYGMKNGDYVHAFNKIVLPVAKEFNPSIIIVASGFDAASCDPIGECDVTPECYAYMTSTLRTVGNGRLVISLEGGYNLDAIANSMLGCAKALLDIKWKSGLVPRPATMVAYASVSRTEISGQNLPRKVFSPSWRTESVWDPMEEVPDCCIEEPSELARSTIEGVIKEIKPYWKCLS